MVGIFWAVVGIVGGGFVAIQAPINAALGRGLGMPVAAAAASFLSGTLLLVLVTMLLAQWQGISPNWRAPAPWLFVAGGALGAAFVTINILLVSRIGAAATMAFVVTGQLIAGMLIDRAGFMEVAIREISLGRVAGALLLLGGALLIRLT